MCLLAPWSNISFTKIYRKEISRQMNEDICVWVITGALLTVAIYEKKPKYLKIKDLLS